MIKKLVSIKEFKDEVWVDVIGYEEFYRISNYGNFKRKKRAIYNSKGDLIRYNKPSTLNVINGRYMTVGLNKDKKQKQFTVHRLVASHFVSNKYNKPMVNHLDGNKHNNAFTNLEWCTCSENLKHAFKTGLKKPSGLGLKRSKETRNKISKSLKGLIPWNKGINQKELIHGTAYCYNKGCRCEYCKEANKEKNKFYNRNKSNRSI